MVVRRSRAAKRPLNHTSRVAARKLKRKGLSYREIGRIFGVSGSAVHKALLKTETERRERTKETRGVKPLLSPEKVKKVQLKIRKLEKTRTIDAQWVQRHFRLQHCSLQTIRRVILRRDGRKYVLRSRKPVVHVEDMKKRLAFARALPRGWKNKVHVWMDNFDVHIPLYSKVHKTPKTWARKGQKLAWYNTGSPKSNKAPLVHFMPVLACQRGVAGTKPKLVCLPSYKRLTAATALEMWKRTIMPALRRHYGNARINIVQDKCSKLNHYTVLEYLKEQNVHVLFRGRGKSDPDAPSRFSEFFPVENVHGNVKKAIVKRVDTSRKWRNGVGKNATKKTMQQWSRLVANEYRKYCAKTMEIENAFNGWDKRRVALIKNKGGGIGY